MGERNRTDPVDVGSVQAVGGLGAAPPASSSAPSLGSAAPDPVSEAARRIAFLPVVHGGLGLRSSKLLSPAAYWAAWADILPIIAERAPALGARVVQELESEEPLVVILPLKFAGGMASFRVVCSEATQKSYGGEPVPARHSVPPGRSFSLGRDLPLVGA